MSTGYRDRVETGFESWGRFIVAHPKAILLASLLVALSFASGLPRVYLDVTFEAFLGEEDEVRVAYDEFREHFGRDERIIVAVDAGNASDERGVFTQPFIERLRTLHEALESRVPHLVEVTSLINARDTYGEGDTLVVSDFFDPVAGRRSCTPRTGWASECQSALSKQCDLG